MKRFIISLLIFSFICSPCFANNMDEKEENTCEIPPEKYGIVIEYLNEKYPDMRTIFNHRADEIMVAYIVARQLMAATDDFYLNVSYTATSDPTVVYFGYLINRYDEPVLLFIFQEQTLDWRMSVIIPSRPVFSYTTFTGPTEAIEWLLPYMEEKCGDYFASVTVRDILFSYQIVKNIINSQ